MQYIIIIIIIKNNQIYFFNLHVFVLFVFVFRYIS